MVHTQACSVDDNDLAEAIAICQLSQRDPVIESHAMFDEEMDHMSTMLRLKRDAMLREKPLKESDACNDSKERQNRLLRQRDNEIDILIRVLKEEQLKNAQHATCNDWKEKQNLLLQQRDIEIQILVGMLKEERLKNAQHETSQMHYLGHDHNKTATSMPRMMMMMLLMIVSFVILFSMFNILLDGLQSVPLL